jgi:deoxyribodipyrimidine photo-lyase
MRVYSSLTLKTILPPKSDISLDPTLPLVIYTDYSIRPDWMSGIGANRVLVLTPSHFERFPVSGKVIEFILSLARDNIEGIQIYIGEIESLRDEFRKVSQKEIYLTDHILYSSVTGVTKTPYPYMVPEVTQYCASFFAYWKQAEKYVMRAN